MRLSILAVLASLLAGAVHAEEGKARWLVKTEPPLPGAAQVVPIETLIGMPNAPGVVHNDRRYQAARIRGQEGQLVTTTGWLWLVAHEGDDDYHIQLSASPTIGAPCVIVESPDPAYVPDPALKAQAAAVRAWIKGQLFGGRDPAKGGTVLKHPVQVVVSGSLFFDDSHVGDAPRGKKGMKCPTLWELHPITSISFAVDN